MNKKLQVLILLVSLSISNYAQDDGFSRYINYQGVAGDASGAIIANQNIIVTIALRFNQPTSSISYEENHDVTTDQSGVFSLQIGNGTVVQGDYSAITWEMVTFVTVSIDGNEVGTTQLHAVPFALRALRTDNVAARIDDLEDAKSDNDGSSLFLGVEAGKEDDGSDNRNVGIGYRALYSNTTGNLNTANGHSTLYSNTTGNYNTANGFQVLYSNTTGRNNIANGYRALYSNTTGRNNTANGSDALYFNSTGILNTANGSGALYSNTTASKNTANGSGALYRNTTGTYNTANGYLALSSKTTGSNNTANGYGALYNLTGGSNNIGIGFNAQVLSNTASNQVRIGNTSITYAGIQVAWTITSDAAWKRDIQPLTYGLDMVTQLKPVDYTRKNNAANTREIGFIAQDIELLLVKLGYTNSGILTRDDNGNLSLRYNDFIPILTKAIQEQQTIIEKLTQRITALER